MHTEEKWTAVITPHDRNLKREIAEEKNISDIEVMLEEKDQRAEANKTFIGDMEPGSLKGNRTKK